MLIRTTDNCLLTVRYKTVDFVIYINIYLLYIYLSMGLIHTYGLRCQRSLRCPQTDLPQRYFFFSPLPLDSFKFAKNLFFWHVNWLRPCEAERLNQVPEFLWCLKYLLFTSHNQLSCSRPEPLQHKTTAAKKKKKKEPTIEKVEIIHAWCLCLWERLKEAEIYLFHEQGATTRMKVLGEAPTTLTLLIKDLKHHQEDCAECVKL